MSGWYEMYDDLKSKGELPDWMDSFEMFMQNLDVLDISPTGLLGTWWIQDET
jgi:hypothetical protein